MAITTISRTSAGCSRNIWTKSSFSTISSIVDEQLNSIIAIEEERQEEEGSLHKPRFKTFGKKIDFGELNSKCLEQDSKAIKELEKRTRKSGKTVKFKPIFLERVCLFFEEQPPCKLKEAHDKQLLSPSLRIICTQWPTISPDQRILLEEKSFSITPDNSSIYDSWETAMDVDANFFGPYLKNTNYDTYEFIMTFNHQQLSDCGEIRARLEFAIHFTIDNTDYWDNNDDKYYQIKITCDPLNNPLNQDESMLFDSEEELDTVEKHQQFKIALKDYQHAKPYHLNKGRPCWLGTRYDFGESLYLAKTSPSSTVVPTIFQPDLSFINAYLSMHTTSLSSASKLSPAIAAAIIPASILLEFNSALYLNLLKHCCFYTSDHLL